MPDNKPPTSTPAPAAPPAAAPPASPPAPAPAAPASAPAAGGEPPAADPFAEADAPYLAAIRKVDGEPEPNPNAAPAAPKPSDKPAAAPAKPAPTATPKPGDRGPAPELRKQYEATKTELETLRTQHNDLQSKITEYEQRGKDTEAMRERLASMEKEHSQLQAELRAFRQEQSPEFKAKFDKPFDEAAEAARHDISELEVIDDPENGEVRPADWKKDFAPLYRLPLAQALKQAKAKFGDEGSQVVMHHFQELKRLERTREKALAEEKEHAQERMKQEEIQLASRREQERSLLERVSHEFEDKIEYYRDDPADKEAIEARKKALAVYDSKPTDPRVKIVKEAHVRHRVAAFPVLVAKILKLERELAAFKGAGGGGDDTNPNPRNKGGAGDGGGGGAGPEESWEDGARKAMSQT